MIDDLVAWLRAQLEHHADVHRKLVDAEGEDLPGERECDPDGFWAVYDAHTGILDAYAKVVGRKQALVEQGAQMIRDGLRWTDEAARNAREQRVESGRVDGLEHAVRCLSLAYQHADGYREEWRPQ